MPAPSPSAAVLARRASREAKSMLEESGSEEDSDEPVEWEGDDEASSEEDGSEDEVRVSRTPSAVACGFIGREGLGTSGGGCESG